MLDCKHASELLSQAMERRLSLRQRMALRLHLLLCDACTQFARQLELLRKAVMTLGRKLDNDDKVTLPLQARERIAAAVANQSRQSGEAGQNPETNH